LAGIAHVAFRVTDVQKSRDFYRTLGFEQSFEFTDTGKSPSRTSK
jgi:catechol 2,3-dioxygenase-like lactoylglutathione lyase family enzyme